MAAFECKYSYRVPGLQKAPAEVTGRVFEELANSEGGLSPRTLVDASRDENAPLHNEFEWRDDVAAETGGTTCSKKRGATARTSLANIAG